MTCGADPAAWRAAGFAVDADGTCRVGEVRVRLTGGGRHIRSWSLRGLRDDAPHDVDGLVLDPVDGLGPCSPAEHPNGTTDIDHVVVTTPDLGRTVRALEAIGLEARRYRDAAPGFQQAFFRLGGPVILEVAGPTEPQGDGPARFFGLAVNVRDLD